MKIIQFFSKIQKTSQRKEYKKLSTQSKDARKILKKSTKKLRERERERERKRERERENLSL